MVVTWVVGEEGVVGRYGSFWFKQIVVYHCTTLSVYNQPRVLFISCRKNKINNKIPFFKALPLTPEDLLASPGQRLEAGFEGETATGNEATAWQEAGQKHLFYI